MDTMFAVEFNCEETGEHGFEGPFETWDDAMRHYNYPGYGEYRIVKVSNEKALEIIHEYLDAQVELWMAIDPELFEPDETMSRNELIAAAWGEEADKYMKDYLPGWKLLKYGPAGKQLNKESDMYTYHKWQGLDD